MKALITGITGQDGAYLAKFLLSKGYDVYGIYRRISTPNFWRLQAMGVYDQITLIPADITDMPSLLEAVARIRPDEIYNLAAQSYVGASFDQPIVTTQVDGLGAARILEIIRHLDKNIKFYQASTSELFGKSEKIPQNEQTPFYPNSPYAAAKLYSFHLCRIYRQAYNVFACNGILFNHESPLRGLEFVTRKITNAVARIKLGVQDSLKLGNLEARRDWGFAQEYVEAMWLMLQAEKPTDYVVATGETHTVREFAKAAFEAVDLNSEDYISVNQDLIRPAEVNVLCGNPEKIRNALGWEAKTKFAELVKIMVDRDIERWEMYLDGKLFPWDAPNYSSDSLAVIRRGKVRSY